MTLMQTSMPAVRLGQDLLKEVFSEDTLFAPEARILIVPDAFLIDQPALQSMLDAFDGRGLTTAVFSDFAGEPQVSHIDTATALAIDFGATDIIGIGGGSALDIAKSVSACAESGQSIAHYALAANPMPARRKGLIQVPTTAGTGSEANGTAIFAGADGAKLWAFSTLMKPDLAVLDAGLLKSLPPHLKTWTGLDAFVHAFEAATNRWSNPINLGYAKRALGLVAEALPDAVQGAPDADEKLIYGSFLAGYAIENTGTAIAHCASHAMASFAPIHHGRATAIAFEATLNRVVRSKTPNLAAAAATLGTDLAGLESWITDFFTAAGFERTLSGEMMEVTTATLAREMLSVNCAPMRNASLIDTSQEALEAIASDILKLAA